MARDRFVMESVELTAVLDVLDDVDARAIIRGLEEPMAASEISGTCNIPLSTTYRKLDLFTDVAFFSKGTQTRTDGYHATIYEVAFDEVQIALNDERDFDIAVGRPEQTPDERLADI